jgi:hypothetical protein
VPRLGLEVDAVCGSHRDGDAEAILSLMHCANGRTRSGAAGTFNL